MALSSPIRLVVSLAAVAFASLSFGHVSLGTVELAVLAPFEPSPELVLPPASEAPVAEQLAPVARPVAPRQGRQHMRPGVGHRLARTT